MTMELSEVGWKRQRRLAPVREELEQVALAQPRGALLAGAAQLAGQPLVQLAGSLLETDRTLNITDQSGRAGGLAGSWDRASAHGNGHLHGDRRLRSNVPVQPEDDRVSERDVHARLHRHWRPGHPYRRIRHPVTGAAPPCLAAERESARDGTWWLLREDKRTRLK